jgi:hypothetical protein
LILKAITLLLGLASFALECLGTEFNKEAIPGTEKSHLEHPVLTANIFSIWSFGWMTPLMKKGARYFEQLIFRIFSNITSVNILPKMISPIYHPRKNLLI